MGAFCIYRVLRRRPTRFTQPTVSHHLAILREAGLVNAREEGKQTFYSLNQEKVAFCCGQLMFKFAPETEMTEAVKKSVEP